MTQAHAGVRTSPEAARDRLIVALDVPRVTEAIAIAEELGDIVSFYKIGPHLLLDPELHSLFRRLKSGGKNVFLDCKLFDIPATVAGAGCRQSWCEIHHGCRPAADNQGRRKSKTWLIFANLGRYTAYLYGSKRFATRIPKQRITRRFHTCTRQICRRERL